MMPELMSFVLTLLSIAIKHKKEAIWEILTAEMPKSQRRHTKFSGIFNSSVDF